MHALTDWDWIYTIFGGSWGCRLCSSVDAVNETPARLVTHPTRKRGQRCLTQENWANLWQLDPSLAFTACSSPLKTRPDCASGVEHWCDDLGCGVHWSHGDGHCLARDDRGFSPYPQSPLSELKGQILHRVAHQAVRRVEDGT